MSWLRLDDKFVRHPKITRLTRGDRWTWLEVLSYCCEYRTEGFIPETIREVVPKATGPFLNRCYELHLLDLDGSDYRVHDWHEYNPKDPLKAERMARWRAKKRESEPSTPPSTQTSTVDERVDEKQRLQNRLRDGAPSRPVPVPVSKSSEVPVGSTAEVTHIRAVLQAEFPDFTAEGGTT